MKKVRGEDLGYRIRKLGKGNARVEGDLPEEVTNIISREEFESQGWLIITTRRGEIFDFCRKTGDDLMLVGKVKTQELAWVQVTLTRVFYTGKRIFKLSEAAPH